VLGNAVAGATKICCDQQMSDAEACQRCGVVAPAGHWKDLKILTQIPACCAVMGTEGLCAQTLACLPYDE
jgi:hypothetical protein